MSTLIVQQLEKVHSRIVQAAQKAGRNPEDIKLLAVSKKQSIYAIEELLQAGQLDFGENYLQEALPKIAAINNPNCRWHFIGRLQSNKAALIAQHFAWVHTVCSIDIAQKLNQSRQNQKPLNVCIQVKVGEEAQKAGLCPSEVEDLAQYLTSLPNLKLRGLMTLPPLCTDSEEQRRYFQQCHLIFDKLCKKGYQLDTLSMGTSHDLEAAILEGANWVRIGTAIFGERQ